MLNRAQNYYEHVTSRAISCINQYKLVQITKKWFNDITNLIFLTLNLFISFILGAMIPTLLCQDTSSEVPPINWDLFNSSFLIFSGTYLVIRALPHHLFKSWWLLLIDTFLTGLTIIVIGISQNIEHEPVIEITDYGSKPTYKIISTETGKHYHVDVDNYIVIENPKYNKTTVKTLYHNPIEVDEP